MPFPYRVKVALQELGFTSPRAVRRAALATVLCVAVADVPLCAVAAPPPAKTAPASNQLQGQERILHALNRFTFGPRPGEAAAVEKMGLQRWFERQLNPSSIDDSALDARLASFPAMQLSIAELNARYPGPAMIRAMEAGKVPLPSDPTARIIASDSIAFYRIQKARQAASAAEVNAASGSVKNDQAASQNPVAGANDPSMAQANTAKPSRRQVQAGMNALDDAAADPSMANAPQKPLAAADLSADPVLPPSGVLPRDQIAALMAQTPDARYQAVLAMPPADLIRLRGGLRGPQLERFTAGMTPVQQETIAALPGGLRMVAAEETESRLLRDIYSDRELEAVMTDFWLNHFNVYIRKNQIEPYLIPAYERETVRSHALGNFEDLLVATAKSPAMLVYLDNWQSTGPDSPQASRIKQRQALNPNAKLPKASSGLNENYGRELMELHTLGVNGGYSQADVTSVAKVFTGWTVDRPYQQGGGEFHFDERRHEPGAKTVLGRTIPEGGMNEGLAVLHLLATSPATALFISEKLAERFVSDTPPPALVDRMAQSFLTTNGDIKSVLRTLFNAPEFWSPAVDHAKVKTPLEFVASAARAGNVQVTNALGLVQSLDKLGMPLYGMQTPNGYRWKKDEWVSTGALVTRLNFALVMTADRLPGVCTDWSALLSGQPGQAAPALVPARFDDPATSSSTPVAEEKRLESILLGAPASDRTRQTVLAQAANSGAAEQAETQFELSGTGAGKKGAGSGPGRQSMLQSAGPQDDPQAATMAGLLLGSPEFQRR